MPSRLNSSEMFSAADLSRYYVRNKVQFHLHQLTTEQRHPKTMNLSQVGISPKVHNKMIPFSFSGLYYKHC